MKNYVSIKQAFELSAKLNGGVEWDKVTVPQVQKLIDSARQSAAHFEEFIRQGGRLPLDQLPIKIIQTFPIDWGFHVREELVAYAKSSVGKSSILSGSHDRMVLVDTLPEPKNVSPRQNVNVHVFEISADEGKVLESRMFELFKLFDVYPTTVPEAFAVLNGSRPTLVKKAVLLNACRNEVYGNVKNMLIEQPDISEQKYSFGPIGGDIEDDGCFYGHHHYFGTSYV